VWRFVQARGDAHGQRRCFSRRASEYGCRVWLAKWSVITISLAYVGDYGGCLFGQKELVVARQAESIFIILMADDDLALAVQDVVQGHAPNAALLCQILLIVFTDIHLIAPLVGHAGELRAILICIGFYAPARSFASASNSQTIYMLPRPHCFSCEFLNTLVANNSQNHLQ
jgi:hypothetical protein